jgi:hypothetical protein
MCSLAGAYSILTWNNVRSNFAAQDRKSHGLMMIAFVGFLSGRNVTTTPPDRRLTAVLEDRDLKGNTTLKTISVLLGDPKELRPHLLATGLIALLY